MSGATVEVKCKNCKSTFRARVADRKRGWGKYCSKSCKAIKQTQRTGYTVTDSHRAFYEREYGGRAQFNPNTGAYEGFTMSPEELSHGGYGDADPDTPFGNGKF